MKFIKKAQNEAVRAIYQCLMSEIEAGKRVLWLVSGGSNMVLEVDVMKKLNKNVPTRLSQLAILPIDERYGHQGHSESNIQQLRAAGFDAGSAIMLDVLVHDQSFDKAVEFYNDAAGTALDNADVVVAQIGMGADGHILGIKPGSPACTDGSKAVIGYEWDDYARMTLSISAIKKFSVAFVPAYGKDKRQKLVELKKNQSDVQDLPAELLYDINEVYIYNDQLGG